MKTNLRIALCLVLHLPLPSILTVMTRRCSSAGHSQSTYSYWHLAQLRIVCVFEKENKSRGESVRRHKGKKRKDRQRQSKVENERRANTKRVIERLTVCLFMYWTPCMHMNSLSLNLVYFPLYFFYRCLCVTHIFFHVSLYISVKKKGPEWLPAAISQYV